MFTNHNISDSGSETNKKGKRLIFPACKTAVSSILVLPCGQTTTYLSKIIMSPNHCRKLRSSKIGVQHSQQGAF